MRSLWIGAAAAWAIGIVVNLVQLGLVGFLLLRQRAGGVSRRCVAFRMTEKTAPPRPGYWLHGAGRDGRPLGQVTSGTLSPSLGVGIGMGFVPPDLAAPGTPLMVEIRGRREPAVVVARPIYRRPAPPAAAAASPAKAG